MANIKKLAGRSFSYSMGIGLSMLAGLVSFPIFTRVFSVSEYGDMTLMVTTYGILITILKLGSSHSIVRFYQEYSEDRAKFFTSVMCKYSIIAIVFILGLMTLINVFGIDDSANIKTLINVVLITILIDIVISQITSYLRARHQLGLYNLIVVLKKYLSIAFAILFIFHIYKDVNSFFWGQLAASVVVLTFVLISLRSEQLFDIKKYDSEIFNRTIKYGFPLVWSELGHQLLSYADRYMIRFYLGSASLGVYAAGYNLSTYVTEILMYPIYYAIEPMYFEIYQKQGHEETQAFLSRAFSYFCLVLFPVVLGFIAVSKPLLTLLATNKYSLAAEVIPYIVVANAVYSLQGILNAGLFIAKKTAILMKVKILSCLFNIALNAFLIPNYGIKGAAQATLITYIVYTVVVSLISFREIRVPINIQKITKYFVIACVMYSLIINIKTPYISTTLLSMISLGCFVYAAMIVLFDRDVRIKLRVVINRYRTVQ